MNIKLPVNYEETHFRARRLVREEYVRLQDGKCYYCKGDLRNTPQVDHTLKDIDESLFPDNFFEHSVHLHHSHDTGMTIGAVHAFCNAILWQYHNE